MNFFIVTLISILGLGIILLGFFLGSTFFSRKSLKKESELLVQISNKERELSSKLLKLSRSNDLLKKIDIKLLQLKDGLNAADYSKINEVRKLIKDGQHSYLFEEFELSFSNINPGFIQRLVQEHDNLSPGDLRLAALLKLNLSTKEIASMTFRNPTSVKTARTRLRKKLGIKDKEMDICKYLNSISN